MSRQMSELVQVSFLGLALLSKYVRVLFAVSFSRFLLSYFLGVCQLASLGQEGFGRFWKVFGRFFFAKHATNSRQTSTQQCRNIEATV